MSGRIVFPKTALCTSEEFFNSPKQIRYKRLREGASCVTRKWKEEATQSINSKTNKAVQEIESMLAKNPEYATVYDFWQSLPNTITHRVSVKTVKLFLQHMRKLTTGQLFKDVEIIPIAYRTKKFTIREVKRYMQMFNDNLSDPTKNTGGVQKTGIADFIYNRDPYNREYSLYTVSPLIYMITEGYHTKTRQVGIRCPETFLDRFMKEATARAGKETANENRMAIINAANESFKLLKKGPGDTEAAIMSPHTAEMMPTYVFDALEHQFKDVRNLFQKLFLDFFWNDIVPHYLRRFVHEGVLAI